MEDLRIVSLNGGEALTYVELINTKSDSSAVRGSTEWIVERPEPWKSPLLLEDRIPLTIPT